MKRAVLTLLAVVLLATRTRRWRVALPTLVFGLAAVTSMRNIPPASLVLLGMGLLGFALVRSRTGATAACGTPPGQHPCASKPAGP